jgi:hypothetical protein
MIPDVYSLTPNVYSLIPLEVQPSGSVYRITVLSILVNILSFCLVLSTAVITVLLFILTTRARSRSSISDSLDPFFSARCTALLIKSMSCDEMLIFCCFTHSFMGFV